MVMLVMVVLGIVVTIILEDNVGIVEIINIFVTVPNVVHLVLVDSCPKIERIKGVNSTVVIIMLQGLFL